MTRTCKHCGEVWEIAGSHDEQDFAAHEGECVRRSFAAVREEIDGLRRSLRQMEGYLNSLERRLGMK